MRKRRHRPLRTLRDPARDRRHRARRRTQGLRLRFRQPGHAARHRQGQDCGHSIRPRPPQQPLRPGRLPRRDRGQGRHDRLGHDQRRSRDRALGRQDPRRRHQPLGHRHPAARGLPHLARHGPQRLRPRHGPVGLPCGRAHPRSLGPHAGRPPQHRPRGLHRGGRQDLRRHPATHRRVQGLRPQPLHRHDRGRPGRLPLRDRRLPGPRQPRRRSFHVRH